MLVCACLGACSAGAHLPRDDPEAVREALREVAARVVVTRDDSALPVGCRPRTLARYFARRHARGERLRLLEPAVGLGHGLGQIEFRLDRRADDLRRLGSTTTTAHG